MKRWEEDEKKNVTKCSLKNCDEQADEQDIANDQIQRHAAGTIHRPGTHSYSVPFAHGAERKLRNLQKRI